MQSIGVLTKNGGRRPPMHPLPQGEREEHFSTCITNFANRRKPRLSPGGGRIIVRACGGQSREQFEPCRRRRCPPMGAAPTLGERAEFGFWSGNVLIRRALDNEDPEIIMKHLYAAGDHYRKALAAAPDDWDLKYNFELVQYVLRQQELDRQKEEARIK